MIDLDKVICKCGHSVPEHQENGCWHFDKIVDYGDTVRHCECMIPDETVLELHERRLLVE